MALRSALTSWYRTPLLQLKQTNFRRLIQRNATMASSAKERIKERDAFNNHLPSLLDQVEKHSKFSEVPGLGTFIRKMLEYNVVGGKCYRGLTIVFGYEMMEKPENITEETLRAARTLGWCVEMLQTYFLMLDDIMDGASTRRGGPCWYRMPGVGLSAINDAQLITCVFYMILKETFGSHPHYMKMVELFQKTTLTTSIGQHLDVDMVFHKEINYDAFTMERWACIAKHKTSYYTFYFPVALAMYMSNITNEAYHTKTEEIAYDIGHLFQMQDDYLDCYGEESTTGKAATDIKEGKCTWLAVKAFNKCTPKQKIVFKSCYRSKEPAHIERIKFLYDQLDIQNEYLEEEKRLYDLILKKIKALPEELQTVQMRCIDMTYKRTS